MTLSVIGAILCGLCALANGLARPSRWYHLVAFVLSLFGLLVNIMNATR